MVCRITTNLQRYKIWRLLLNEDSEAFVVSLLLHFVEDGKTDQITQQKTFSCYISSRSLTIFLIALVRFFSLDFKHYCVFRIRKYKFQLSSSYDLYAR